MTSMGSHRSAIIVFDADCLFCSGAVRFVLRHDRDRRFRFAALQGAVGRALARDHGIDSADPSSMLLVEEGRARHDSDAVLTIASGLGWPWRLLSIFRVVPRTIRDRLYRWIARNRYRLFGRRETCFVPDTAESDRFL